MTELEVVDSAVKIGLGAFITAVATIAVTLLHGRHERKTEIRKRRFDLIERLAGDFEQIHPVFIELFSSYATCLESTNRLTAEMSWKNVAACIVDKVGPALTSLHGLEGRLLLVGAAKSVRALTDYRTAATALQNEVRMIGGTEGPPPTPGRWDELGRAVHECRTQFFEALRKEYERT